MMSADVFIKDSYKILGVGVVSAGVVVLGTLKGHED